VSNKAEQQSADAPSGAMGSAERDASPVDASAETAQQSGGIPESSATLPSIIVDPSLSTTAPALRGGAALSGLATATGDAAAPGNGADHSNGAPHDASAVSDGEDTFEAPELSTEDAERFASKFRASWEPPMPAQEAFKDEARVSAVSASPNAAVFTVQEAEPIAPGEFPGAAQRRRGMLMAAAAIAGFAALVTLALVMSTRGIPDAKLAKVATNQTKTELAEAPGPTPPAVAEAAPATTGTAPPALRGGAAIAEPTEPGATAPTLAAAAVDGTAPTGTTANEPTPVEPVQPAALPEQPAPAVPAAAEAAAVPIAAAQPAAPAEPEIAPAPAPQEAPAEPAPAARVEPAPAPTIHVAIAVTPADAQITLDGASVANPFDARAPKGGRHRVIAEAPGRRARDLTLNFDRDQTLDITLENLKPKPPVAAVAVARPKAKAPAPHRAAPAPAPAQAVQARPKGAGFVSESPY
jgi:hypothetical protein